MPRDESVHTVGVFPLLCSAAEANGEDIYGNIQHQRLGAMGGAGERWESYWKTETLFRTDETSSPKK